MSGLTKRIARNRPPVASPLESTPTVIDTRIQDLLVELQQIVVQVQEERDKSSPTLESICKTQEKMKSDAKVSSYYKTKLRSLYNQSMSEASAEATAIRRALDKIAAIKMLGKPDIVAGYSSCEDVVPKKVMRRGVLMTMLQQDALTLPLWLGTSDTPPPLCGSVPAESNYIVPHGGRVAARVKGNDGEENWILATADIYYPASCRYEIEDVDEETKEVHTLSRRRVIPLPLMKPNPETHPVAVFPQGGFVLALYPQTTCFYKAIVHKPPEKPQDDYSVLFEDPSYADGFSPPLSIPQLYVVTCKDSGKKRCTKVSSVA